MFSKVARGAWWAVLVTRYSPDDNASPARRGASAVGNLPSTLPGFTSQYQIEIARPTKLLCRLQTISCEATVAIGFSIFETTTARGAFGKQVLTGGAYSDRPSGVVNEPTLVYGPAKYVAVLSTFDRSAAEYEFIVYSSLSAVNLDPM